MKCIFLDFDGVINNWNNFYGVDDNNALILKNVIDLTNAKVVVTSSNKYSVQLDENINYQASIFYRKYVKRLHELGIEIYALTPLCNRNRSLEIKKYLEKNNVEQYVIVDDELVDKDLQEHQVFLDLYKGLQEEHIEPIINILNGKLGFYPETYDRKETSEELVLRINRYYKSTKK